MKKFRINLKNVSGMATVVACFAVSMMLFSGCTPEEKEKQREAVLDRVAERYYGEGAAKAREAWTLFSTGYREFPYSQGVCYRGPQQMGASNLFYLRPTGYSASMVGIPYDDLGNWCGGLYPPHILAGQFRKIADHFARGLPSLRQAVDLAPPDRKDQVEAEYRYADATRLHFASSANMTEFNVYRNHFLAVNDDAEKKRALGVMKNVIAAQKQNAREMYRLAKSDSQIGYEASNQYFYIPIDIAEALLSARHAQELWGIDETQDQ